MLAEKIKNYFKNKIIIFIDLIIVFLSFIFSLYIAFNFNIPSYFIKNLIFYFLIFAIIKISLFIKFNIYKIKFRNINFDDMFNIIKISFISSLLISVLFIIGFKIINIYNNFLIYRYYFPTTFLSVVIIDFFLFTFFIGFFRVLYRSYRENFLFSRNKNDRQNTLIIGAGNAGEKIVKDILKSKVNFNFKPLGYIDDDKTKYGKVICGIKVLGNINNLEKIIKNFNIESIIIAIPSVHYSVISNYINACLKSGVQFNSIYIVPPVIENISKVISIYDVRELEPEDLLGREELELFENEAITSGIMEKTIMITGAGGSIGSVLARKIASFNPKLIILFEIDETEIFFLVQLFNRVFPDIKILPIVGDIKDKQKIECIFEKMVPDMIFHAAAYKHVPIMEFNVDEAITNNIHGTDVLCNVSIQYGVKKFVLISTDKAVNPSSIMGTTKRIAEAILAYYNRFNKTKFISVRFGNVLGSRGSLIPILKEQIKKREPLTITHPEMERYFMSIDEAALLILYATTISDNTELFFLDMGKKIRITDIAYKIIKFYGLEPDRDIKITYIGIRPGEKLTEEILYEKEKFENTSNKKIFKITNKVRYDQLIFKEKIDQLIMKGWMHCKDNELRENIEDIIDYVNQQK